MLVPISSCNVSLQKAAIAPGAAGSAQGNDIETQAATTNHPPFQYWRFYQNRFARVMPVYYFCTLLAVPQWIFNFTGWDFAFNMFVFITSLIVTIIPLSTLLSPLIIMGLAVVPINTPSWTICTLIVMWLFFPCCLIRAQRWTDQQLIHQIFWMFFLQFVLLEVIYYLLSPIFGFWPGKQKNMDKCCLYC